MCRNTAQPNGNKCDSPDLYFIAFDNLNAKVSYRNYNCYNCSNIIVISIYTHAEKYYSIAK